MLLKRAIKTEIVVVTQTVAQAVVYVDENGVPYLTSTVGRVSGITTPTVEATPEMLSSTRAIPVESTPTPSIQPTATSAPLENLSPSSSDAFSTRATTTVAPLSNSLGPHSSLVIPSLALPPQALDSEPSSVAPTSVASANAARPSSSTVVSSTADDGDKFPLGITYDPFKGVPGQCQCKTASELAAEFEKMKNFGMIRIYGNDCGVIPVAVQQAKKRGQKLMAGIYTPNQDINTVVNALSDAVDRYNDGNWDIIRLVSVENERVNAHVMTASDAQDSIGQARAALSNAGYSGPVGVVETAPAVIDNPSLCEKSDMTLVNIHAFFDPNTKAEDAGDFVKREVERVRKACPGKRVVVTESGWPSQGTSHDKAVASKDAQKAAINSIRAAFDHDLFLFNAFDSLWKTDDDSTWNSERYWGIL